MDREERLRRRRERDRARRLRETAEEKRSGWLDEENMKEPGVPHDKPTTRCCTPQRRQRWSQNHGDSTEAIPLQSCDNDVVHLRNKLNSHRKRLQIVFWLAPRCC